MRETAIKTKAKNTKGKSKKKPASKRPSLEESYKRLFIAPGSSHLLSRVRLTMYKSVPTVTTYGAYEKPI